MRKRSCLCCGRTFIPRRRHQHYCSRVCRLDARRLRRGERRYYARRTREQASFRASFTPTPDAVCATCGTGLHRERVTRRYCSNRCRQRAYRGRIPSAARIKERFDQELARVHADLASHRRQRLVLRAAKGDQAAAELTKLE
jgi:hypothetical protein